MLPEWHSRSLFFLTHPVDLMRLYAMEQQLIDYPSMYEHARASLTTVR